VAAKPTPRQQCPSIKIEDKLDYYTSVPPHNPQHILEAANGSDDNVDTTAPPQTKKPVITKQHSFVEIEDIEDESDHHTSVPPCNPQHILEAANGSDDNINKDPASASKNERGETPEESKEAELDT
jgi:hypothetical protein